jgi:hypothetical protein
VLNSADLRSRGRMRPCHRRCNTSLPLTIFEVDAMLSPGMLCLSFEGGLQRIQEMCSEPGEPDDPRQCATVKCVPGERTQSAGSSWKSGVRWLTD